MKTNTLLCFLTSEFMWRNSLYMKEKSEMDIYDRAPGHVELEYNNNVLWF